MEIFRETNFDFLGKKWPFIILSLALTAAGLISLFVKGGPRYGIDFTGGALMDVNFIKRPPADAIRNALHKKFPGQQVEVQEITQAGHRQEVFISTGVKENGLSGARSDMTAALNAAFNRNGDGKLDINQASQTEVEQRLQRPIASAGVPLSFDQLQALVGRIEDYRNS